MRENGIISLFNRLMDADPKDLTPGDYDAVPTSSTFSAGTEFAFSPDGALLAYTSAPRENEAWSTNHDIYVIPVTGGKEKRLTEGLAAEGSPRFSPDGKWIAYRAQSIPGHEADRWQLQLYDRNSRQDKRFNLGIRWFCRKF